jgi:hypothetical protein
MVIADDGKPVIAKPLAGLGAGVTELPCVTGATLTGLYLRFRSREKFG